MKLLKRSGELLTVTFTYYGIELEVYPHGYVTTDRSGEVWWFNYTPLVYEGESEVHGKGYWYSSGSNKYLGSVSLEGLDWKTTRKAVV